MSSGEYNDFEIIDTIPSSHYELNTDIKNINLSITNVDEKINQVLIYLGLPTENVVAHIPERMKVFKNLEDIVNSIECSKDSMTYLSKFIHAITNGLFDAALNYLWDATINELRTRVSNYDVEYFYDVTIMNQEKRNKLSGEKDLDKIQDSDLLRGVKEIELINNITYNTLDHIRYMRNWASTAHPNEETITGFQIIDWLETCILNVFNLPVSDINLEIKKLLSDIKTRRFEPNELDLKSKFFESLTQKQISSLLNGVFGIYCSETSGSIAQDNINGFASALWALNNEETKEKIGFKYGNYYINGHDTKAESARQFLEVVSGQSVIPENLKVIEISNILEELNSAHYNNNNFYSEPSLARELRKYVEGDYGKLPPSLEIDYVTTVVKCFLTNGYGIAWNADTHYMNMIENFTAEQAMIALFSYLNEEIEKKLSTRLCQTKFLELLTIIDIKITNEKSKELIKFIQNFKADNLIKFKQDSNYKKQFSDLVNSVGLTKIK